MKSYLTLLLLITCLMEAPGAFAQTETDTITAAIEEPDDEIAIQPMHRHPRYISNALDAGIFSAAALEKPGANRGLTALRFSFIANIGFHFNYDFDEFFGLFTGLGIKNIGFTERTGERTIQRRVYTIGAPIGFKFGNLAKRNFVFLGGGLDVPFNYKVKIRQDGAKQKRNDFFSEETASMMPYLFAGASVRPGITLKLQFYPGNFFNVDYEETVNNITTHPYRGYDARLLLLSLGLDIHYRKSERPTNTPQ